MRSEMINFAYGVNYSQLLLLSSLNSLSELRYSRKEETTCNFIISYEAYLKYKQFKDDSNYILFEPFPIPEVSKGFIAEHIGKSKGYYFILKANH
jgi:hypothetical protein